MGWIEMGESIPMITGGPANSSAYQPNAKYVLLLGLMCALPAVTSDIYLPSLPEVEIDLHTTNTAVQLTMSGVLVGGAVGQLVVGPLSDRFGRRLPVLIGIALHIVMSLTQYLPDSWKPIIDTDIDGLNSAPAQVDQDRPLLQARAVTRRLARSIFIGSAPTLRSAHRGVERQRIWLGAALPGDTVGNFGSALDLLAQRATYLYSEGNRYWYDTQPSVTRTAADYADGLREKPEEVWVEVVRRLRDTESRHRGGFAAVSVAPDSSAEIQDGEEVRLVILHPSQTYSKGSSGSAAITFAADAFERRGTAHRTNRNLLVLLAPDVKRMDELAESTRSYLAWKWVEDRQEELNLSPQQFKQVTSNVLRNND